MSDERLCTVFECQSAAIIMREIAEAGSSLTSEEVLRRNADLYIIFHQDVGESGRILVLSLDFIF